MIRDITIGQYYPAQSPIHRLDPRVKIVCTLIFLVSLFVQNSVLGYALAFVFLACMIHVSKVPAKFIGKGLKPIVILLLFTVAMNLFLTRGSVIPLGNHYDHRDRTSYFCVHGSSSCTACCRIFFDDIYNDSERIDRWTGETASSTEPNPCTGTRNFDDDVYCTAFYSDSAGRDRQDHEGADCKRS